MSERLTSPAKPGKENPGERRRRPLQNSNLHQQIPSLVQTGLSPPPQRERGGGTPFALAVLSLPSLSAKGTQVEDAKKPLERTRKGVCERAMSEVGFKDNLRKIRHITSIILHKNPIPGGKMPLLLQAGSCRKLCHWRGGRKRNGD